MTLHVLTFNIHHGRGTDDRLDLPRIADVIRQSKVDLVGLNEVDKHFSERSHFIDQAEWLAGQLNMYVAYGPAICKNFDPTSKPCQYGNALLSRYPIVSHDNHHFDFGTIEHRALLEAAIEHEGRQIKVFVTHLSLDPFMHRKQTHFISEKVYACSDPVILLGDWNMKPDDSAWGKITHNLIDIWHEKGKGRGDTFPSWKPRSRLDYIFVSAHFHTIYAEVRSDKPDASDHLPLAGGVELDD